MKSCALVRTNVGLTTNVKLMVGSNYAMSLDSIISTPELSSNKYKKFQFNKDTYWDDIVPLFFQKTPTDIAYKIKYDDDSDKMSTDFANQYDDIYQYGARNISSNKFYSEEFEYFAPLYLNKNKIPTNFIIFRVDGPGLLKLNKDNFRDEILKKLKCVKNFDLTLKTSLGQWINLNFTKNKYYPNQSLYIDFRRLEFSSWKGIDYEKGGYTEKNLLLDSTFEYEQPFFEMERLILDGYKNNKIIFPNIINFSFLFDDTPATINSLRKWSINRYLGFYLDDLTLVKKMTPNKLPKLKTDVRVNAENILYSPSSDSPFLNEWEVNDYPYLEIDGVFYRIEKFEEITESALQRVRNTNNTYEDRVAGKLIVKYKIISEISLSGKTYNQMNNNLLSIDSSNLLYYQNGTPFVIPLFNNADVWLIEIGDKFHNIVLENGFFKIFTDYGFSQSAEKLDYFINKSDPNYTKSLDLVTKKDNPPVEINIYKCQFTDIKDFDTDIVDTDFSKFEYQTEGDFTLSDEPKMYMVDLDSNSQPKDYIQFRFQNKIISIPTPSEYTANSELFRIVDNKLNSLWRKNSERLKWGFVGSKSTNDYPYLLNNATLAEDYNKTANTKDSQIQRAKRNLDHFYTINSNSEKYTFHSLHVEDYLLSGVLNTNFRFDLSKYLTKNAIDYFSYFFGKKNYFNNTKIQKKTEKFSYFQTGDSSIPNVTLFRGLKFNLSEVQNINISNSKIERINLRNSNKFDGWKFSILVSENKYLLINGQSNVAVLESENVLRWRVIDDWKHEKLYDVGSLVVYNEILYTSQTSSRIMEPLLNPSISSDWATYSGQSIFYSPYFNGLSPLNNMSNIDSKIPPLVHYKGEYYYSDGVSSGDFWQENTKYATFSLVLYDNKNWLSLEEDNTIRPSENAGYFIDNGRIFLNYWRETNQKTRWSKVDMWRSDSDYQTTNWNASFYRFGNYAIYNDVVYCATQSVNYGVPPDVDPSWKRIYSLVPDTNYLYGPTIESNNIIFMNGKYYQCVSNDLSTIPIINPNAVYNYSLDNGIYVFINEVHKNVLVNIYVNDNTYSDSYKDGNLWKIKKNNLMNTNRDDIYTTIFQKLSTNNLMNCLNDLSNKFGFSDLVKYVVFKEDGGSSMYDFNDFSTVTNLPYLLTCEPADEFLIRNRSNIFESVTLNSSEIKAKKVLNDSIINTISEINHYNEMHLGSKITKNVQNAVLIPNYSGMTNDIYLRLYRFSGFYGPVLRTIELFDSATETNTVTNYKFDTSLTNFGIIKERIISKVNRKNNLLRFRNDPNLKSLFPMIDEYGYHFVDFFMFKSTWDYEYHYETQEYDFDLQLTQLRTIFQDSTSPDFQNNNTNLL